MLESPKISSRDTSVDAPRNRNRNTSSAEFLGGSPSNISSVEKKPSTDLLGEPTPDIPSIKTRSATGFSNESASEAPSTEFLGQSASEAPSIEKGSATESLGQSASETPLVKKKSSSRILNRLSIHRKSRSESSEPGNTASDHLTPPSYKDASTTPRPKSPGSDGPHASRSPSRSRLSSPFGNISPWHHGDIVLDEFLFSDVNAMNRDGQIKNYSKLIPQVDARKPHDANKRSAQRKERAWNTAEALKGTLDPAISGFASNEKFKALLNKLEAHVESSAKATDSYYNYLWSPLTRLTQFIRGAEKTGKVPIEALSKELVAFNSAATNRQERLKAMERSAGTNAARTVEWVSTVHEAIRLVEGATLDYSKGGNIIDSAATVQLANVSGILKGLEAPKILKFADIAEISLAPASIEQILLEKPVIRRNIPTPDSAQEGINRILKPENATEMQKAVKDSINHLQLPTSQSRDNKKQIEVTALMSQLAHEPIKHAENLETLKKLENFSNSGKPLDVVRREADERKTELEIKAKGKNLISYACDKVWKSGHPSVAGIEYNNKVITEQIKLAENSIETGEVFNPEKLHDAIERHTAHCKDFVDEVIKYADAHQEFFLEEKAGEIVSKKWGLFHEEFKASQGLGNVAQKLASILGQLLASKAIGAIPF